MLLELTFQLLIEIIPFSLMMFGIINLGMLLELLRMLEPLLLFKLRDKVETLQIQLMSIQLVLMEMLGQLIWVLLVEMIPGLRLFQLMLIQLVLIQLRLGFSFCLCQ